LDQVEKEKRNETGGTRLLENEKGSTRGTLSGEYKRDKANRVWKEYVRPTANSRRGKKDGGDFEGIARHIARKKKKVPNFISLRGKEGVLDQEGRSGAGTPPTGRRNKRGESSPLNGRTQQRGKLRWS